MFLSGLKSVPCSLGKSFSFKCWADTLLSGCQFLGPFAAVEFIHFQGDRMARVRLSVLKAVGALIFVLVAASLTWGQVDTPDRGFRPFGSYQLSDIDSVNLTNGNLILHIPIVSYPQRGDLPPLSLSLRYNNPSWSVKFHYAGKSTFGEDVWFALWGSDGAGTEIVRHIAYSLAEYDYGSTDPTPNA